MKRSLQILVTLVLLLSTFAITANAHSGRTDANGGHNCSEKSISKGLCTGYHYHNGGSSTTPAPAPASQPAPVQAKPITVYIKGIQQTYQQPPVLENGTTLVPLRGIFEALGATVDWNQQQQLVTAEREGTIVKLTIGSKSPTVNGKTVAISVPAQIRNGSTLVPLRFVSEALGATVNYDSATKTISIN